MAGSQSVIGAAEHSIAVVRCPTGASVALGEWIARSGNEVDDALAANGAILFRGFGVTSEQTFQEAVEIFSKERLKYIYRSTPRREVADRIYTATEYPRAFSIPLHNENSFQRDWPMRLMFCCIQPPTRGGNTPLACTEKVTRRIAPAVRDLFKKKHVMYVRNYGMGIDLPWETVFQTTQRQEVEEFCRSYDIEFEWRPRNCLRTRQVCQAMAIHPQSGLELWFNQAHLFHASSLDSETQAALRRLLKEEDLPRNAFYGDGTEIEPEVLNQIRAAFEVEKTVFRWELGDVLLLDNMLVCHGREPYEGDRKILAAMALPLSSMSGAAMFAR